MSELGPKKEFLLQLHISNFKLHSVSGKKLALHQVDLCHDMQAAYLKPVQTGFPEDCDARLVVSNLGMSRDIQSKHCE